MRRWRGFGQGSHSRVWHGSGTRTGPRTEPSEGGLLVVDYAADGRPLGVEITSPQGVTLDRLNELLRRLGQPAMAEEEFRPVRAA